MTARSLSILVVENQEPLSTLVEALRRRGHDVTLAHSSEEALQHGSHDVLVADLGLGRSGLDVVEGFRGRGGGPRTVVVSGEPSLESCRLAMRLGAVDYLIKPIDIHELVRAVEGGEPRRKAALFERDYQACKDLVDRGPRDIFAYTLRSRVGPSARARIAAATAEVLENTYRHAYLGRSGEVRVRAELDSRSLRVEISDDGVGFDSVAELDSIEDCAQGGLARVCALAEDVRIDTAKGRGTTIAMRFDIQRVLFDEEGQFDLTELDWMSPETARMVLETVDDGCPFQFSPALAVTLGRLLAGPDPRRVLRTALWS